LSPGQRWRSLNGLYISQIDYMSVNSRFTNTVLDVKSAQGADFDTNHLFVVGKLKVTLKKTRSSKKLETKGSFDVQKLEEPIIRDVYLSRIDRKISSDQ